MKFRPDTTTSERQLVLAMAGTGRPISLAQLAAWRRDGLLPPLASQGMGPGKGKSYYWREEDIVPNACAAYDLLAKYGRPDTATWLLFLSGFSVPLPQLRRAWAHRCKSRRASDVRPAAECFEPRNLDGFLGGFAAVGGASALMLNVALSLCGTLAPASDEDSEQIAALLNLALARVLRPNHPGTADAGLAAQLWRLIRVLGTTLEASNLIAETSDADMREAQHYLCVAGGLLQECSGGPPADDAATPGAVWSDWLAERAGPPLFLFILVLLRSGRRDILQNATQQIEGLGRQSHALPAQSSYLHA